MAQLAHCSPTRSRSSSRASSVQTRGHTCGPPSARSSAPTSDSSAAGAPLAFAAAMAAATWDNGRSYATHPGSRSAALESQRGEVVSLAQGSAAGSMIEP